MPPTGILLGEIGGEKAHHLLHTHYQARHVASDDMLDPAQAKDFHDKVLHKYPRVNSRLTNILSDVVDHYGYVSDDAVVAVASHVRKSPVHIDSVLSHYHFFPRQAIAKSMVYLCECPNCRMKGAGAVKDFLKAKKIPFRLAPWLGWCVNGAPAALVKHMGDPQVHAVLNLTPQDERFLATGLPLVHNPFPQIGSTFSTAIDCMETARHQFSRTVTCTRPKACVRRLPSGQESCRRRKSLLSSRRHRCVAAEAPVSQATSNGLR